MNASPPPGWYPNANGQQQWWDGQAWGQLAPAAPAPAAPSAPAPYAPGAVAPSATAPYAAPAPFAAPVARQRPVPPAEVSKLVWWSMAAVIVALVLAAGNIFFSIVQTQIASQAAIGSPEATPLIPRVLTIIIAIALPLLCIGGLVLAIIGRVRSRRKRPGTVAIILAAIGVASPLIFTVLGFVFWFVAGGISQLNGGSFG